MRRIPKFSDEAEKDLEDIYEFGVTKFGIQQARKYLSHFNKALNQRLIDPETTTKVELDIAEKLNLQELSVRSFLYEKHRCYFVYDDMHLYVTSIVHTSRSKEVILKKLTETFLQSFLV